MMILAVILFLSYHLMLIVMTFNAGLFIATVLGLTAGFVSFLSVKEEEGKIYNPMADKCCSDLD